MTTATAKQTYELFINGEPTKPASGEYMDVLNPATNEVIASRCRSGHSRRRPRR